MNMRDILLSKAMGGGGNPVSPGQIEQAVNNYLDKNPVESYTLPVGGDKLGGVRNGGNVTIKADGTMDAPEASGGGIDVTGASVGQIVQIASVDANGVPTAWQPVDLPTGGGGNAWKVVEGSGSVVADEADKTGHHALSPTLSVDGTWTEAILESEWVATSDISTNVRLNCFSGDHINYESAPINTTKTLRRYHVFITPGVIDGYPLRALTFPGKLGTAGEAYFSYPKTDNKYLGFYGHWFTIPAGTTVEWVGRIYYR